jgi:hypothetical protein
MLGHSLYNSRGLSATRLCLSGYCSWLVDSLSGELPTPLILADNSKNLNELCQKASQRGKTVINVWLIHINANIAPRVQTFTLAKKLEAAEVLMYCAGESLFAHSGLLRHTFLPQPFKSYRGNRNDRHNL